MTDQKFSHIANVTFISACDNLAREFCDTLGISHRSDDCWWVSYGSVFAFQCGEMFTNAEDMMLVVEHRLTWEQWSEFYDQWTNSENHINLNSWLMGARPEVMNL